MVSNNHTTNGTASQPKITLYTNHRCPYAQRTHITLKELGLPYDEVLIDLDTPRPQWYLDINPRGLVPSIKYTAGPLNEEILTESQIIDQFLADSKPSHLVPPSLESPLFRARLNFFIDTWNTKVQPHMFDIVKTADEAERQKKSDEWLKVIEKELEPLLKDANPFFGGSKELTLAEVQAGPFLLRTYSFARRGEHLPSSFLDSIKKLPNFSKWAEATQKNSSVTEVWDEEVVMGGYDKMIARVRARSQ